MRNKKFNQLLSEFGLSETIEQNQLDGGRIGVVVKLLHPDGKLYVGMWIVEDLSKPSMKFAIKMARAAAMAPVMRQTADKSMEPFPECGPECGSVIPPDDGVVAGFPQVHDLAGADLSFNINCANGAKVKISAGINTIEIEGDVIIKANLGDDAAPAFRWGDCTSVESPMPNRKAFTEEEIMGFYRGSLTVGGIQGIMFNNNDATPVKVDRVAGFSAVGPDGTRIYTKPIREVLSPTDPTGYIDASQLGPCIDEISAENRIKTIIEELHALGIFPLPEKIDEMTDAQRFLWNATMWKA